MERTDRTRRARAGLAIGAAAITALGATGSASAARTGAGGPLRDGVWSGQLAVGATIDLSTGSVDVTASGEGTGQFSLFLAGGTATGEYHLGTSSESTVDADGATGEAVAVGAIDGTVNGTSTGPIMQPSQAHFDVTGSVTVGGFESPIATSLDLGATDLVASTLVITSSSCAVASGTWAEELAASVAAAGGTVTSFEGSWAATFTGTEPGVAEATLAELLERGETILAAWLAGGVFDSAAMEQVLIDAEHVAIAGPVDDACSRDHRSSWASPLAGMVERLLTAMAHSPSTTPEALRFGVAAGLRTGVLPSVEGPVEADLLAKATSLLDAAVDADDAAGATLIAIAADAMGWTELSAAATEALGG